MTHPISEQRLPPEVTAIVSQQDGAGNTTTAVNLAIAMSAAGQSVLLVELDHHGKAGHALVRGYGGSGAAHRLLTDAVIRYDMIAATEIPGLYLLSSDDSLEDIEKTLSMVGGSRSHLQQGLETLSMLPTHFDRVVIDCPPGLGLVSLNGLVAAHRILVAVPVNLPALKGLPAFLKAIERLRAGFPHPLRGTYLLATLCSHGEASQSLVARLRQEHESLCLYTDIPLSDTVREAEQRKKPAIAYCPRCDISQAYMALAAEWLTLDTQGRDDHNSLWHSMAFKDSLARYSQEMQQRVEAWLLDPSSSLYDEDEDMHNQDAKVMDEIFKTARQSVGPVRSRRWIAAVAVLTLVSLATGYLLRGPAISWATVRLETAAWLIGSEQYWQAGSVFLSRSDETAYRELILAAKLIDDNRRQLMSCGDQARATGTAVTCSIAVQPPR
ncbi:AAA family ATPase [Gammaproteobacteria bacterium]